MLFNSIDFIVFFIAVLVLYYALPQKLRWILVLIASCIFYMVYKPVYILVLFAIIFIDYTAALLIERSEKTMIKKTLLVISLLSNIGILAYFKYYNFIFENFSLLLSSVGHEKKFQILQIILPVGLSFHTFQSMAYTIDVAKGKQKAEKHLGYFANFVLFFPQMVAGPIEKYATLGEQLKSNIEYKYENISKGFRLILYGFFVKIVIADSSAVLADAVFNNPQVYSTVDTWIGVLLFSIQIYADFFGYSIIAVGAALCMGIKLMDNFDHPYFSPTIIDFWKRWHISLTNWFREYVYFPLGGNKVTAIRRVLNILLVFTLSGLWHGASWNFIWWGTAHGVLYLLQTPLDKFSAKNKIVLLSMILINFLVVSLVWILFRAKDMKTVSLIGSRLFSNSNGAESLVLPYKLPVILLSFLAMELLFYKTRIDNYLENKNLPIRWALYSILIVFIFLYSETNTKPFIYFQF